MNKKIIFSIIIIFLLTGAVLLNNSKGSSPNSPFCVITFKPFKIPPGYETVVSWFSWKDADGKLPYTCTDGSKGEELASGSKIIRPTQSITCTAIAENSTGKYQCMGTVTVGDSSTSPQSCLPPASGCGPLDQWSCINGTCQPASCGDGVCNLCDFSPCSANVENSSNCPQDCSGSVNKRIGAADLADFPSDGKFIDITNLTSGLYTVPSIGSPSQPLWLSAGQGAFYKYTLNTSCSDLRIKEYNQENSPSIDIVVKKDNPLIGTQDDINHLNQIVETCKIFNSDFARTDPSCAKLLHPNDFSWYEPAWSSSENGGGNAIRLTNITPGTYYIWLYYANRTNYRPTADYVLAISKYKCDKQSVVFPASTSSASTTSVFWNTSLKSKNFLQEIKEKIEMIIQKIKELKEKLGSVTRQEQQQEKQSSVTSQGQQQGKFIGPFGVDYNYPPCIRKTISSSQPLPPDCNICVIGQKYVEVFDENGKFRAYCPDSSGNIEGGRGPGNQCGYGGNCKFGEKN